MVRLCFVCLGNICRSPTAEGIMLQLVEQAGLAAELVVESAGTGSYHVGERPDRRTLATARARGVVLPSRARQWQPGDFAHFDLVLAMDLDNREALLAMAPDQAARDRVLLLRSFDPEAPPDAGVPDPYYGGADGFEEVFEVCAAACRGLLAHLRTAHRL